MDLFALAPWRRILCDRLGGEGKHVRGNFILHVPGKASARKVWIKSDDRENLTLGKTLRFITFINYAHSHDSLSDIPYSMI